MRIGYLGPSGSYSHEAACRYLATAAVTGECIAMPSFSAIIDGVEQGQIDHGVIPIENSTGGAVTAAMDGLVKLENSTVCGEIILDIEHCLLSMSASIADINYVFSHEQALGQCCEFFRTQYPHIQFIQCGSTSQACEMAQKSGSAYGAVAGKAAAQLYQLPVVVENIQDNDFNQTRFLIIGVKAPAATGKDKTSIIFAFHDDCPGSLFGVLKAFASRNINLTRIESRPAKHSMGKYIFYIDFVGHAKDESGVAALQEMYSQVSWLKVLGSYPAQLSKAIFNPTGQ